MARPTTNRIPAAPWLWFRFSIALVKISWAGPGARSAADADLIPTWIERNDAQNYVVLGDPAVRLRVDDLK